MAVVNPPPWLQNSGATNTAQLIRTGAGSSIKGPTASTPNTISGKGGVVIRPGTGGTLAVTQNGGGNMSVNVASGVAHVRGTENIYQGGYWVLNDASVNLTVTASDPVAARTDSVYVAIRDAFYSGVNNDAVLAVAAGNPATPTTPPTLPANSLELYRINVRAATTSILTSDLSDRRPWLTAQGGITPLRSFETTDPGTINGDVSFIDPTGLRFWDSTASVWRAYPHFVAALTDITNNATPKTNQIVYLDPYWYKWNGSSWIQAAMPNGLIARGRRSTSSTTTTTIVGVERLDDYAVVGGRSYNIRVTGLFCLSTVAGDRILVEVRFTTDGSTPTTASPVLAGGQLYQVAAAVSGSAANGDGGQIDFEYEPGGSATLSLLVTVSRNSGTGSVSTFSDPTHVLELKIYDSGIGAGDVGTDI